MKCDVCQRELEEYGTDYYKLSLERNYQSQGYPAVFTEGTVHCCTGCIEEGAKLLKVLEIVKRRRSP